MRFRLLALILVLLISACTFQMEVLTTPTPQPTEEVLAPFETATLSAVTESSATSTAFPTNTLTSTPSPQPTIRSSGSNTIQFPANGTWQDVVGDIAAGASKTYTLSASKGQVMSVSVYSDNNTQWHASELEIKGEDGSVLCPTAGYTCPFWRGPLPATQKYFITLTSPVSDTFKLRLAINPPGKAKQYFGYADPQGNFSLSYSDEFAPVHYLSAEGTKFPPQLILEYIDTPQYVPTNLIEAYFIVGTSEDSQAISTCTQPLSFGGPETIVGDETVNGVTFTKSEGGGVGAGNIYQQIYYRTVHNATCYEITYFIHYGNIGNYASNEVKEFDEDALLQALDETLSTLVLK
jgi:hypothetical protein